MNLERLNHLKVVMQRVHDAKEAFYMGSWADAERAADGHACGTTCCSLGYAALDSKFREEGLTLQVRNVSKHPCGAWVSVSNTAEFNKVLEKSSFEIQASPIFGFLRDFEAGAGFFDISTDASDYLFYSSAYGENDEEYDELDASTITPLDVIAHIDQVIACNGKSPRELRDEETED